MGTIIQKEYILKNGKQVLIRTALTKDAKEILSLNKDIMAEHYFTISYPEEYTATVKSKKTKLKFFKKNTRRLYLVAVYNHKVIGIIYYNCWPTRKTYHCGLLTMFIEKKWRGFGLGTKLLDEVIEWGKSNPLVEKISLSVFSTNKNAITLYKKLGFKTEGCCPKEIKFEDGSYADTVMMYRFVK